MLITAEDLTLEYKDGGRGFKALNKASIFLDYTGFNAILGPSGSGKSSLLYLLSGIKKPNGGQILYCGYPFPESEVLRNRLRRQEMGFIFQSFFLIKYLTVFENILVGADRNDPTQKKWVTKLIDYLGLDGLSHRFPGELSGGQRQRVSIARALANKPKVIFADEPTAFLDHENGKKVIALLENISKKACVVIVTHDESLLSQNINIYNIRDGNLSKTMTAPSPSGSPML